jgi:hypothetical protein
MTAVTVYTSNDSGAPQLTSTAGSMAALLKAVLVTGYGAKAGAGWTNPFSGSNKEVFRQGGGSMMYLRVEDNDSASGGQVGSGNTLVTGYEVMTGIDAGTGPFPTAGLNNAFSAAGVVWNRVYGNTQSPFWMIVANHRGFFFYNQCNVSYDRLEFFGDTTSLKSSDGYAVLLTGYNVANVSSQAPTLMVLDDSLQSQGTPRFMARSYTQIGGAVRVTMVGDHSKAAQTITGYGPSVSMAYPNGPDGGVYLSPLFLGEPGSQPQLRGTIPGGWCPLHHQPFQTGDTFAGSGTLAGRTFIGVRNVQNSGSFVIETSDTWYS